jgi:hypothetical protein
MKKVTVYCGESIQDKCGKQVHPATEVLNAKAFIESNVDEVCYSNHPDFISGIKYIGKKNNVQTEFFLNGVSCGDDIELIFGDLNRALDLINELGETD